MNELLGKISDRKKGAGALWNMQETKKTRLLVKERPKRAYCLKRADGKRYSGEARTKAEYCHERKYKEHVPEKVYRIPTVLNCQATSYAGPVDADHACVKKQ